MTALNWRKGLTRLWLLGASVWLCAAPFWTDLPNELSYAVRYIFSRDELRSDLIARGACIVEPVRVGDSWDLAAGEVLGVARKPSSSPAEIATAASVACEANNRTTRLDSNGAALPREDCAAAYTDSLFREMRANEVEKKRRVAEVNRQLEEAEKRCNEDFTPEPPTLQTTLVVLGIPTFGVAAAFLMLFAAASAFRWVARGFRTR